MKTTEPIRSKQDVYRLTQYYRAKGQIRNLVLVTLGIHTALRISDILRLTWDDVRDFAHKRMRASICITEKKTGKAKIIALNPSVVQALTLLLSAARPGRALIENERTGKAISRIQAYRIIRAAAEALGFEQRVSCHSLRKTFGYHSWKEGISPAIIMEIYNHSSLQVTRRYLGVTQDDLNSCYLQLSFAGF